MRAARPDIAFSSDFIVGAPGETRHDFEATLRLVREVGFASAYSFKYSARPGTPASIAADQVDEQEKSERLAELQDLLESQRRAFNATFVGRRVPVLFEKRGRHAGQIVGKSPYLQAVFVEGPETLIGHVTDVELLAAGPNAMAGRLCGTGPS
jgi:tRNA-2-methylthio-N6-dimethylallyladenosine synthase